MWSRRQFLSMAARSAPCMAPGVAWFAGSSGAGAPWSDWLGPQSDDLIRTAPRARYWATTTTPGVGCGTCHTPVPAADAHAHDPTTVSCLLCAQRCVIPKGQRGRCRARVNVNGELRSLVYGRPFAVHLDPIEKKPFYHFLPGRSAFSLGTAGCPLRCKFCQNWQLSQASPEDERVEVATPARVVDAAVAREAPIVAFTYNEPTVFTEYLLDIAAAARHRSLRSVLVSCGFMTEQPLADMCRALDAIKIDLKGFSEEFYHTVSGAALAPVLRSIRQVHRSGVHLEIVNLVVPTLNDAEPSLKGLADWVMGELGPDVPLHFTRFHPDYQLLNLPPTPVATLDRARALAMDRGLHYVYVGNVPDHPGNHTYCPSCRKVVIRRENFFVAEMNISHGRCKYCGAGIAGVWQ